jgi:hypothetical protein
MTAEQQRAEVLRQRKKVKRERFLHSGNLYVPEAWAERMMERFNAEVARLVKLTPEELAREEKVESLSTGRAALCGYQVYGMRDETCRGR